MRIRRGPATVRDFATDDSSSFANQVCSRSTGAFGAGKASQTVSSQETVPVHSRTEPPRGRGAGSNATSPTPAPSPSPRPRSRPSQDGFHVFGHRCGLPCSSSDTIARHRGVRAGVPVHGTPRDRTGAGRTARPHHRRDDRARHRRRAHRDRRPRRVRPGRGGRGVHPAWPRAADVHGHRACRRLRAAATRRRNRERPHSDARRLAHAYTRATPDGRELGATRQR